MSARTKPKPAAAPPVAPAVAPARTVWILRAGCRPERLSGRRTVELDDVIAWCYEGDQSWRPIATLLAKGGAS